MAGPYEGDIATLRDGRRISFWTSEAVEVRLMEMGETLRRLRVPGCWPRGYHSLWPDYVREYWQEFSNAVSRGGRWEEEQVRLGPPSSAAIDRMEACFEWFHLVDDPRKRKVLWGRALGVRTGRVARLYGWHRNTVRVWYGDAIESMVRRLNAA